MALWRPTVTSRAFWESGEAMRLTHAPIHIDCPVRLLHGMVDPDVPYRMSLELADRIVSDDVRIVLIKDGDHRLSRDGDLNLLAATLDELLD